jgi:hypothetical protein
MKTKICSCCKIEKNTLKFSKRTLRKSGIQSICKVCETEKRVNYRQTIWGYLINVFYNIKQRCTNPEHWCYSRYGGRGIQCRFSSSKEFALYVIEELRVDPRGLDTDRIDINGHYEPGNIQFITHQENCVKRFNI